MYRKVNILCYILTRDRLKSSIFYKAEHTLNAEHNQAQGEIGKLILDLLDKDKINDFDN